MLTTLSLRSPVDLLAAVPVLIGSPPCESLVAIARRGGLQNAVLRVDLPRGDSEAALDAFAAHLVGMLCRVPDIDGVLVAVFTDAEAPDGLPFAAVVDTLEQRLHESGLPVLEAACRAGSGWGAYGDRELPGGGHPLSELDEADARMATSGPPRVAGRPPFVPLRSQRDELRRRAVVIRRLLDDIHAERLDSVPHLLEPLFDLPEFFEDALGWDDATLLEEGALLLVTLQGPPCRDMAMLQWAYSLALGYVLEEEAERFSREGLHPEHPDAAMLGDLMMGVGPAPDRERIGRALHLLQALLELSEEADHPPLLSMLAWLNWALGQGSAAGRHLDRLAEIDPRYGMGEVLASLTSAGRLPEWMYERPEDTRR